MLQLRFTLKLETDYHIGAGHGLGSQIDSALLRDADAVPVFRGSTLEGLLRDGLWRLVHTPPLEAQRACQASGLVDTPVSPYCTSHYCPLCAIFGTPARRKRWSVSSARPVGAETPLTPVESPWRTGQTGAQTVARVRVNPRTRRAAAHQLFSQEEGDQRLLFTFTVSCATADATAHHEAAMLVAAARMVRHLGAARRRGRGACVLTLSAVTGWQTPLPEQVTWQEHLLGHFQQTYLEHSPPTITDTPAQWTTVAPGASGAKRWRLIVRLDEPCVIARRAEAGNIFDCAQAISGVTVLGAMAAEAAARWDLADAQTYDAFLNVFRRGHVRFSPLYMAYTPDQGETIYPTIPVPRDLLVCKVHQKIDGHHSPMLSYAAQSSLPLDCPSCASGIPLVSRSGFVAVRGAVRGVMAVTTPHLREEMHPRIDPVAQRVATGDLFGYVALESGQYFGGDIWCRDQRTWETLRQLTGGVTDQGAFQLRLGKATRRGYGLVTARMIPLPDDAPDLWRGASLEQRITTATDAMTLTLLTDAIVPDAWGRFRQQCDEALLQELLGIPVQLIHAFCTVGPVDHFNNQLGLPRWRDIALQAGSAAGFTLKQPLHLATLQARLRQLEAEGIGVRRHEGFGRVVFNHPVYASGHGVPDMRLFARDYTGLALASAPQKGPTSEVKSEFEFLQSWSEDLGSLRVFQTSLFPQEQWQAVARWLHSHASQPLPALRAGLQAFGKAEVLTPVERAPKDHFTKRDAAAALEHIGFWLDRVASQSTVVQRLAVELLANRIAASVDKKGR